MLAVLSSALLQRPPCATNPAISPASIDSVSRFGTAAGIECHSLATWWPSSSVISASTPLCDSFLSTRFTALADSLDVAADRWQDRLAMAPDSISLRCPIGGDYLRSLAFAHIRKPHNLD